MRLRACGLAAAMIALGIGSATGSTLRFSVIDLGTLDGHLGYFREMTSDGVPQETQFLFLEGQNVRAYAYLPFGQSEWQLLPPGTYWGKTLTYAIGDRWTSWVGEPATSEVVDTVRVHVPAGAFACYLLETRSTAGALLFKSYEARGISMVKAWHYQSGDGVLSMYNVAPGQENSFWPLDVGNWWQYTFGQTPTEATSWGAIKNLYRVSP